MLHWKDYAVFRSKQNRGRAQKESDNKTERWSGKQKVIKSYVMPNKSAKTYFQEIVDFLKVHQVPKPNQTPEWFKFNMRDRKKGESLLEYLAKLRQLW